MVVCQPLLITTGYKTSTYQIEPSEVFFTNWRGRKRTQSAKHTLQEMQKEFGNSSCK